MGYFILFALVVSVATLLSDKPGTEVVLLDNDGAANAIVVTTEGGSVTIDTPYEGTQLTAADAAPAAPEAVSKEALVATHGDTFAIAPKPLSFTLYFEIDSPELTAASREKVTELLAAIESRAPASVDISGHADTTGTPAYNIALSEQRAAALKTIIESHHLLVSRCRTFGYGESMPIVPTADETAEPKNRRAEITIR